MSKKILGLDIRHNSISAVAIKNTLSGNSIEAYAQVPVAAEGDFENAMASALENLAREIDLSCSNCAASFPAAEFFFRNFQVPFKGHKKIRQILAYELEPLLPVPADDLIFDFHTLGSADSSGSTHIFVAGLEKARLSSYLDILTTHGIDPDVITVGGGYSTALCLAKAPDIAPNTLLVEIDPRKSTIIAIMAKQIHLIRTVGLNPDTSRTARSLSIEIQRLLLAFEEQFDVDFKPDQIYLTGPGRVTPDFQADIAKFTEYPVSICNLAALTDTTLPETGTDSWNPAGMDPALALALLLSERTQCLNVRRGPFAVKKHWAEHKNSFIKTGTLAILVFIMGLANIMIDSSSSSRQLLRLDTRIHEIFKSTFPEVKRIVDPLQQMRIKIEEVKKNQVFSGNTGRYLPRIEILEQISRHTPSKTDVDLSRLVISPDNILISGITDTFNSVDDIKNQLGKVALFKSVTISSANIDKPGNKVRFKLKIAL
ncbi:MAG: pilus assembly protein PilM [Deltaproteobacteria bacterium]|nr:pilus assembly protein PilM [Deltaproteobacteria bacterium]